MLISLENISKYYGSTPVLTGVSATINPGDRIGLIGPNGSGKTTLLGLISGETEADSGSISRLPRLRVGYFHQSAAEELSGSIDDELRRPFSELIKIKSRLDAAARLMAECPPDSAEGKTAAAEYDSLNTAFESGEGYLIDVKINAVVDGMGFAGFDRNMNTHSLSGGEGTRLGLAKLLLTEPDLLILDEVTNHLDFNMLAFLEDYLSRYKGAVLTVSHDRYFLEKSTNKTWEIENTRLITYSAPYDGYLTLKEQRDILIEKEYARYTAEKARLEDYVRRNIERASTSAMAKSRQKMLERMEEMPPPAPRQKPPRFSFTEKSQPVKDVLKAEGLAISVGEGEGRRQLFRELDMTVTRGDRLGIIGPNGVGKSTLFKLLSGALRPDAGRIEWGRGVRLSSFAQDDDALTVSGTVLEFMWNLFPGSDNFSLRSLLGSVGITGDEVNKQVNVLSGGEKAKLKLAVMLKEEGNVLLMDEPTNHLDIPAKEQLERAMLGYTGTLIAVSHDRHFLSTIPNRIMELTESGAYFYSGGFGDYLAAKERQRADSPAAPPPEKKQTGYYRTKKQRSAQQALKTRIGRCENDIAAEEGRIAEIEQLLSYPDVAADYPRLLALTEELEGCRKAAEALLLEWEGLHMELDEV